MFEEEFLANQSFALLKYCFVGVFQECLLSAISGGLSQEQNQFPLTRPDSAKYMLDTKGVVNDDRKISLVKTTFLKVGEGGEFSKIICSGSSKAELKHAQSFESEITALQ